MAFSSLSYSEQESEPKIPNDSTIGRAVLSNIVEYSTVRGTAIEENIERSFDFMTISDTGKYHEKSAKPKDPSTIHYAHISQYDTIRNNNSNDSHLFQRDVIYPLIVALIIFMINSAYHRNQNKKQRNDRYRSLLIATKREVQLYQEKLADLKKHCNGIIEKLEADEGVVIPSYSFYPNYLETMKLKLVEYCNNTEILDELSNYHFELSHVAARLEIMKDRLRPKNRNNKKETKNTKGLKLLTETTIGKLRSLITKLDHEISQL